MRTPMLLAGSLVVIGLAGPALAAEPCGDPAAVAAVRAAIGASCPCSPRTSAGSDYRRCADEAIRSAVGLSAACRRQVRRCVRSSTCGRGDDAVTCCRSRGGRSRCKISTAARCQAAGACVGNLPSCCDACDDDGGCVTTTTTTTTTTSSQTAPPTTAAPVFCGTPESPNPTACTGGLFCSCGAPTFPCQCICPYTTTTTMPPACDSRFGSCNGFCPNKLTCVPDGGDGCGCTGPTAPCGTAGLTCGGLACPDGQTCTTHVVYPWGPTCGSRVRCECE